MNADAALTAVLAFAALVVVIETGAAFILVRHGAGPVVAQFALQGAAGLVLIAAIFAGFAGYGSMAVLGLLALSLAAHLLALAQAWWHRRS